MKIDWPKRGHAYVESDLEGLTELLNSDAGLTAGEQAKSFENEFSALSSRSLW